MGVIQELQFVCGKVEIFINIYSGEKISKPDQLRLDDQLKALGQVLKLPAGRVKIFLHDLGGGVNGMLLGVEIFGKYRACTSSAEPSCRFCLISGAIGGSLITLKVFLEAQQVVEGDDHHDPVMGKVGDPVPVDQILQEILRKKGGKTENFPR